MPFPSSIFDGLARSVSIKRGVGRSKYYRNNNNNKSEEEEEDYGYGREAAEEMAKDAKKKELILSSSGVVRSNSHKSHNNNNFASVFSRRGQKGINQDSAIVWEEYGCQDDMLFCGVFDGHGPWGRIISRRVKESMPPSLLCNWQQIMTLTSSSSSSSSSCDLEEQNLDIWKQSYLKTFAAIDEELKHNRGIDSFSSGTTALTIVKQGEQLVVANVGDSRAVLATRCDDGSLKPVQLTVDFKPNLPEEAERITQSKGVVCCLKDEPGVYRVWRPNGETPLGPGLAISRAIGDYCVKDFGLISVPHVTHRNISSSDQFIILATDGIWDVISNKEAVEIVSSTEDREKSAKRLVKSAVRAWKYKKRGFAMDDMSAICLFFQLS